MSNAATRFPPRCPSLALAALALLAAAQAATPEEPKSAFWEPYPYDASTAGLYHFDEKDTSLLEAELEEAATGQPAGQALELLPKDEGDGRAAANAVRSGVRLELHGACRLAAAGGRFGGGLLFEGSDGRIQGELPAGPRTLEFWMRPEKPTADPATILHLSAAPLPHTAALRLLRDGALELLWMGHAQRVPGYAFRDGRWTHVALAWDGLQRCEFRLDGALVPLAKPLEPQGTDKLRHYALGGGPTPGRGFRGMVDEVRVSTAVREYYPHTFGWAGTRTGTPPKPGPPFFRDAADLVFHVDFNRTVAPAIAPRGTKAPDDVEEARKRLPFVNPEKPRPPFTDGVEQQAVVVGEGGWPIEYRAAGLLAPERGSIALWMRPLDWNNYVEWNPFAQFPIKRVPLFAIHVGEAPRPVAHLSFFQTPNTEAWQHPVDIHPGRWLHLCLVWEKDRRAAYLDGKAWPYPGAWNWDVKPCDPAQVLTLKFGRDTSRCALDDFRIYRRALSPREIANLAALHDPRTEVRPLPPMEMTLDYNGVLGRVDVHLFPLCRDYAKVHSAQVTVAAQGAREPIGRHDIPFNGCPEARGRVATPPMNFTHYEVKAVARDAQGNPVCEALGEFERKAPPWWGNRIGVSQKAMPGWTPVRASGTTVSVARRDVVFAPSGLPEKVVSVGEDILAAPVRLDASLDGKPIPLRPDGRLRFQPRGEARVDIQGGSLRADGLSIHTTAYAEFDGMMWFRVTLQPAPGKSPSLDSLRLTIPYTAPSAALLHWWSGNHGFRNPRVVHIGATPPGEGTVFSSLDEERVALYPRLRGSFIPYVMLTGDLRGMAWFAENDQGWTQSTTVPAVTIRRDGTTVSLVLNIISEAVRLDGPRTFEFGLHPIPVKPLEKDWRMTPSWGVFPDTFCGFNLKGPQPTQFYRHPEGMDWEMVARRFRGELGSQGAAHREPEFNKAFRTHFGRDPKPREQMVVGLYHDLSGIGGFPSHSREWGGEVWWHRRYTPEMTDYCAWVWNEWVRRGFAKGIYYDNCFNYPLDAWPSPVSYKLPDGTVQPGFQWRQPREHLKRTRQVLLDNGLVPHLCAHTTHTLFIPYHSFFDVILDGEDFYQAPGETRDFMDSWPPDRIRFMNPAKWGLITTWLGWFQGSGGAWPKFKTRFWQHWRAYTAALLAHDIVWTVGHLGGRFEVDRQWLKQSQLCLDPDTVFVPYWSPNRLAAHSHPDLYVSAWRRKGLCVVALVNWSRKRVEAEVALDTRAMGFAAAPTVRDVDSGLLTYFDDDVTRMKAPKRPSAGEELLKMTDTPDAPAGEDADDGLGDLTLKEELTPEQRRAKDPDGTFTWKAGVLRCPVRPHDFRLFEFRAPDARP